MTRVLVVEDEWRLASVLEETLNAAQYTSSLSASHAHDRRVRSSHGGHPQPRELPSIQA
jgi:DNA-binding response OmpR family regulator